MWNMWVRRHLIEGYWDGNTTNFGKVKVGGIVCNVVVSLGRGNAVRKTYPYTRHEWEGAPAVHRPAVLKAQGLEGGTAFS